MAAADEKRVAEAKANPLAAFKDEHLAGLKAAGFDSLEDLDRATDDELRAVPGVTAATVKAFRESQELRGVTPPAQDAQTDPTIVHRPPPVSDAVSQVRLDSSNPNATPIDGADEDRTEAAEPPERCPTCGGRLVPYLADNPHKQGTAECLKCHARYGAPVVA